jgi:sugar phosphate isomerase/epimerase
MGHAMLNRRHFLTTSLAATASASIHSQEPKLSYKGENIHFGLVTYMWAADWDLPTLIANCEAAEILGVELRIDHAHAVSPALSPAQRADVRSRFDDSPVKVLGIGTNCEFHSPHPAELRKQIDLAKDYIKLSHDIGGTGVKVKPNALVNDVPEADTLKQIGKALAELGDFALGFGQQIRLEVHGKETSALPRIRTIMEAAAHDNVRVCWNSNDTDLSGAGLEANFALVKDYLGQTTHIRGVGQSAYPYDKLARLLVAADYAGHVCLEGAKPPAGDRIAALAQERELFMALIQQARATV